MENDNVAIRLKLVIDALGMTSSGFADRCGISRATLSQLLTGRNKKISDQILSQIHSAYPDVSIMWILFGEGSLFNDISDGTKIQNEGDSLINEGADVNSADQDLFSDSEDIEFSSSDKQIYNHGNLNGVNLDTSMAQNSNNEEICLLKKRIEILDEIIKKQENRRRVTHITVYYDDFTFESFFPPK